MILHFEDVVNKIANANKILVVHNITDPGSYAAAMALSQLKKFPKDIHLYPIGHSGISPTGNIPVEKYDLALFVGVHRLTHKYLYNEKTLKVDDSFSFESFSTHNKVYLVNSKNYKRSSTLSSAHFAYEILREFGIETNPTLDLLLMIGDRDDNRELGMTLFQLQLLEKNYGGKFGESPNLISKLGKYKLFNFPTFLVFFDYLDHIGFNYKLKENNTQLSKVVNRVNVHSFLSEFDLRSEKLVDKLNDLFYEQHVCSRIYDITGIETFFYELVNAPTYEGFSLDELLIGLNYYLVKNSNPMKPLKEKFWSKSNFVGYVHGAISKIKGNVLLDLEAYKTSNILASLGNVNLFGVRSNSGFGSKWNWLPFFSWNSILVEYVQDRVNKERVEYMLYSKSNLHAGVIANLAARLNSKYVTSETGIGNGEFFKGSFFRFGDYSGIVAVNYVLNDILYMRKYISSIDVNLKYNSVVFGKAYALFLRKDDTKKIDVYLPDRGLISNITINNFFELSKHYDFEVFDLTK